MNSKALKAVFKIFKSVSALSLNINTQFHLFDNLIKPILQYAREVTFTASTLKNTEDLLCKHEIEKVHKLFIRSVLGVHNKSSLDAIYGETGRFPMYIDTLVNMLKYYSRISGKPHSLVHKAKLVSEKLHQEGINSWFSPLARVLPTLGINLNDRTSPQTLRYKLQTKFINALEERIMQSKKLRTFVKFKTHYGMEPYLLHLKDRHKRAQVCRMRVSAHTLAIKEGRYKRNNEDTLIPRNCKFC